MSRPGPDVGRWWLALGGAALAVSAGLGGLVALRARQRAAPAQLEPARVEPAPRSGCGEASLVVRALADAADPPVILWAAGGTRLFLDGQASFSPPEKPLRFAVGEHALRIESPGEDAVHTRLLLEPFTPALIQAERDEQLGLTVVRLGAACASCEPPVTGLDLAPVRDARDPPLPVLQAAAGHLRRDRWIQAQAALKRMRDPDRGTPAFLRLSAITAASAGDRARARALLGKIPAARAGDLPALLSALDRLATEEGTRQKDIHLARWNKLTEWFAAAAGRYQAEAPGPVTATSKRLEQLSQAFEAAPAATVIAGEEALSALLRDIRSLRPDDCRLQEDLLALISR